MDETVSHYAHIIITSTSTTSSHHIIIIIIKPQLFQTNFDLLGEMIKGDPRGLTLMATSLESEQLGFDDDDDDMM